jgi:hypothetical protein
MCRSVALISREVEPHFLLTAAVRTCEVSESPDFHGLDGSCLLEVFQEVELLEIQLRWDELGYR